jgi:Leucine-rich repeat (LRR) protein
LKVFSAFKSSITDFEVLRGLPLEKLYFAATKVQELSPLAGMPLEEIYFDLTPVTDISSLLKIPTLRNVILPDSAENIEALKKLPNLQRLSFYFDPKVPGPSMTAAEFWRFFDDGNAWMTRLRDSGIKLSALKPLEDGTCDVNFEGSTIQDLTALRGAPITILRLGGTPVSDLSPLRGMNLKKLYLEDTMVTDLSPLQGLLLDSLKVSGTRVADLSPLRGMPLQHLRLHQCPDIADLSPLKDITTLQKLTLPAQAKDFEFLRAFPELERLSFTEDPKALVPDRTAEKFWEEYDARRH